MNKIVSFLMTILLLFTLCSCSSNTTESQDTNYTTDLNIASTEIPAGTIYVPSVEVRSQKLYDSMKGVAHDERRFDYTYDAMGNPTEVRYSMNVTYSDSDETHSSESVTTYSYTYDAFGNMLTLQSFDEEGTLLLERIFSYENGLLDSTYETNYTFGTSKLANYGYSDDQKLVRITVVDNNEKQYELVFIYGSMGIPEVCQVNHTGKETAYIIMLFDTNNKIRTIAPGNSQSSLLYTVSNEMTICRLLDGATEQMRIEYSHIIEDNTIVTKEYADNECMATTTSTYDAHGNMIQQNYESNTISSLVSIKYLSLCVPDELAEIGQTEKVNRQLFESVDSFIYCAERFWSYT